MMNEFLSLEELTDGGYLQEANRIFFHPLGLALTVHYFHGQTLLQVVDCRDEPEGIHFDPGMHTEPKARKIRHEWHRRTVDRLNLLGFMVQPESPLPSASKRILDDVSEHAYRGEEIPVNYPTVDPTDNPNASENPVTVNIRNIESGGTDEAESRIRLTALDRAIKVTEDYSFTYGEGLSVILETAEKFERFLKGESLDQIKGEDENVDKGVH